MTTVKKAPKTKKPATKEGLVGKMKEITFEKEFNILAKTLSSEKYQRQVFTKESQIVMSGELFQEILNERHETEQFMTYLNGLLSRSSENIIQTANGKSKLTYKLMNRWKEAVDEGITELVPMQAPEQKVQEAQQKAFDARYKRRLDQMFEAGFVKEDSNFVINGETITIEEVYTMEEVIFLSTISDKISKK